MFPPSQVHDWLQRTTGTDGTTIRLTSSKAAGHTFTLSQQEDELLECYFCHVRAEATKGLTLRAGQVLCGLWRQPTDQPLLGRAPEKEVSDLLNEHVSNWGMPTAKTLIAVLHQHRYLPQEPGAAGDIWELSVFLASVGL
ncbi:hypothetical protein CesoFtcFv8_027796 [Champsocephalus esox]|uniref:Uncharacterized protein n=1 Tax=Champsocephalus esox TaxID=159716 RepID=A0AAN8G534_9TELE|nr:hypothetical protein CesoFtcFv8_027796 [Champsocephalus esox]